MRVKQKAEADLVAERKSIREIMKEEMDELTTQLKMFSKASGLYQALGRTLQ